MQYTININILMCKFRRYTSFTKKFGVLCDPTKVHRLFIFPLGNPFRFSVYSMLHFLSSIHNWNSRMSLNFTFCTHSNCSLNIICKVDDDDGVLVVMVAKYLNDYEFIVFIHQNLLLSLELWQIKEEITRMLSRRWVKLNFLNSIPHNLVKKIPQNEFSSKTIILNVRSNLLNEWPPANCFTFFFFHYECV